MAIVVKMRGEPSLCYHLFLRYRILTNSALFSPKGLFLPLPLGLDRNIMDNTIENVAIAVKTRGKVCATICSRDIEAWLIRPFFDPKWSESRDAQTCQSGMKLILVI